MKWSSATCAFLPVTEMPNIRTTRSSLTHSKGIYLNVKFNDCDRPQLCRVFPSYDFTPLDSSAVYLLSSMARRRYASQSSGGAVSPDRDALQGLASFRRRQTTEIQERIRKKSNPNLSTDAAKPGHSRCRHRKPIKRQNVRQPGSNPAATRCKRPMNAFMLFAKKFRVQYTQMHPGKDNRLVCALV